MALGPRNKNTVTNGDGNVLIGENTGVVYVGLTVDEHQKAVERALTEKTADLERAHNAERATLVAQIDALKKKLENIQADYEQRVVELENAKKLLLRNGHRFDAAKKEAAIEALDRGETRLAEALLSELVAAARVRRSQATTEEAELEFELGKLAEAEVRWLDAYGHYRSAAELDERDVYIDAYARMSWRLFKPDEAISLQARLREMAKSEHGAMSEKYATHVNNLATILHQIGRNKEAESLYREALNIGRANLGAQHTDIATRLNNLAQSIQAQGRYKEAELLCREALDIDIMTVGPEHPKYAIDLSNLGMLIEMQGHNEEAESLYREALKINQRTIGRQHPDFIANLNNLAGVLQKLGKLSESEKTYEDVLEIGRNMLGDEHPTYATLLNNLAFLKEELEKDEDAEKLYVASLKILEKTLPSDHPHAVLTRDNIDSLRAKRDRH